MTALLLAAGSEESFDYVLRSALDLSLLLIGLLLLVVLLRLSYRAIKAAPLTPPVERTFERLHPVIAMAIIVGYIAYGGLLLMLREPLFSGVLLTVVGIVTAFAWAPIYDLISGVTFRAGRVCRVGDVVRVGDIEGRVTLLGSRVMVLRKTTGEEAVLPYNRVVRDVVQRTQAVEGAHVHAFIVPPELVGDDLSAFRQRVIEASLQSHWGSVVHEPKIEKAGDGRVEISVYAHDEDHAPDLEHAIRSALRAAMPSGMGGKLRGTLLPEPPPFKP